MIRTNVRRAGTRLAHMLRLQRMPGWDRFVASVRPLLVEPSPKRSYASKLAAEIRTFEGVEKVANLPEIHGYWAGKYVKPMLEKFDFTNDTEFLLKHADEVLRVAAGRPTRIINLGSGNCEVEVKLARSLLDKGHSNFTIECVDLNAAMLGRGKKLAQDAGVDGLLRFTATDINKIRLEGAYDVVIASHALHHFVALEHIFKEIKTHLRPDGYFLAHDMIGRNGHMRWPEALEVVHSFWSELPERCRYNNLLRRHEPLYINFDCSTEGFEGIRAQDILPLLVEHFDFALFVPFGNVIDIFVDRCFGHNFDPTDGWATDFIDRVQAKDEELIHAGKITPTHMFAAMKIGKVEQPRFHMHLTPQFCVRNASIPPG
ncbi:class I SAM-dependent methyltransferase [Ramlibacter sp. WS9]|uniref:class I SAM-dependent methyltransferase n=1 Tax=Ramlibacter sp. WS9 TaxID=1882741 RepID=UPI00114468C3|nr:class I SAM-dependent methyltransferase [Ramlibacter sp. WS9]ROZ79133.1 class I SAM-dependent methyltransferase [Ramlibacter sp. WS9]